MAGASTAPLPGAAPALVSCCRCAAAGGSGRARPLHPQGGPAGARCRQHAPSPAAVAGSHPGRTATVGGCRRHRTTTRGYHWIAPLPPAAADCRTCRGVVRDNRRRRATAGGCDRRGPPLPSLPLAPIPATPLLAAASAAAPPPGAPTVGRHRGRPWPSAAPAAPPPGAIAAPAPPPGAAARGHCRGPPLRPAAPATPLSGATAAASPPPGATARRHRSRPQLPAATPATRLPRAVPSGVWRHRGPPSWPGAAAVTHCMTTGGVGRSSFSDSGARGC